MQNRLRGHIINDECPWRVRVCEPDSPYNQKVLSVASVKQGIQLGRGLNVTFVVGTVDQKSRKVLKAVDLALEEATTR